MKGYCPRCQKELAVSPEDTLACPSCNGGILVAIGAESEDGDFSQPVVERPPLKTLLASVVEDLDDGIIACDSEGDAIVFNHSARDLFGLPAQPVPPDSWGDFFDLFEADGVTPLPPGEGPLTWTMQGAVVKNVEIVVVPKDGEGPRSLLVSGRSIMRRGKKLGAVIAMHEITEHKRAEAVRLEKAAQRARQEQALEINDTVVQSLVAARWAISAGDAKRASDLVGKALHASVAIVQGDLQELKKHRPLEPGDFVREHGASEIRDEA